MKLQAIIPALAMALVLAMPASAQGGKIRVLHNFGASGDGSIPYGPLLLDSKGNLYGVTVDGGAGQCSDYGCGIVFELTPSTIGTWGEKILHSFAGGSDASSPWGGLLSDAKGNLYATLQGNPGVNASGIFELSPSAVAWKNTALYEGYAGPGLTSDRLGNLYGDIGSGAYKDGAVGELSHGAGGWIYAVLYNYCQTYCPDGTSEPAPPVWDAVGNLWGVTTYGGIGQPACSSEFGCGVVFEMTPDGDGTWTYNVIHQFASSSTDGQFPNGGLVRDAAGNFYGITQRGGTYNHGTLFRFSFTGGNWQETILYDFPNCMQSCYPVGTLAFDKAGNLYGASDGGVGAGNCGPFTCGVIYKLSPQGNGQWKYAEVHKFIGTDGGFPLGVIVDGSGNLFGVTSNFGKYSAGTAFEITP
jgi:uncharacterized repeat protein (TIGR03803 family)